MADNDIVKFDMDDLKKRVTESAVANFGMLIPEDTFAAMVNKEIKAFFEETSMQIVFEQINTGSYHTPLRENTKLLCTPFRLMVWRQMLKIGHTKILAVFDSEAFKVNLAYSGTSEPVATLSAEMEAVLVKMVPQFMAEQMRNSFGSMVNQAKEEVLKSIRPH